jgi:hypothetical protein
MNHFFITGLPRSRTCWLANLLTYGPAFCHHDALKAGCDVPTLVQTLAATPGDHRFLGDADSGLTFLAAELKQQFPAAKWVFIRHDAKQAEASYRRHFAACDPYLSPGADVTQIFAVLERQYTIAQQAVGSFLEMEFEELNNPAMVENVWRWCVPGEPFHRARGAMLQTFEMNIIPERIAVKL